jgi:SAM-dependent methyltransferase
LSRDFDLIFSTGVLHHLPDPQQGLEELGKVLRSDGSMYLMVYAKYGRQGVYYLQDLFRRIGLSAATANNETLAGILQTIKSLPPTHPLTKLPQSVQYDDVAELVDLFLHSRDQAYSIPGLYDLLDASGMAMQKMVLRGHYAPACTALASSVFFNRIRTLPLREQFAIGELFRSAITMHFFIACRADRPVESYDTDLAISDWEKLVPVPNPAVEFTYEQLPPGKVAWAFWRAHQFPIRYALDDYERRLFAAADGNRNLQEIKSMFPVPGDPKCQQDPVKSFFSAMLDFDYVWFTGR